VTRFVVSRWKKIAGDLFGRRWERGPSISRSSACRSSPNRLSGKSGSMETIMRPSGRASAQGR
jgi:hypothetical protein